MPEQVPTLSDMIQQQVDKGVTYKELEERSADPTGRARISDSQLNRLAKGGATRVPTEDQLRGIAAAVRLPYELVRQAAIAQWLPADEAGASDDEARQRMRAEALQLRAEADRLRAIADDALARIDAAPGGEQSQPQSA